MPRLLSAKAVTTTILVFITLGILVLWWQVNASRRLELENRLDQVVLKNPVKLNPFILKDSSGPTFTNQNLQGRWAFIYFGYTRCGDTCDKTMIIFSQVYDQLKLQPQSVPLIMFISVKPYEDSPAAIQQYTTFFNPHFISLTAEEPELSKLIQELGGEYIKLKSPGIGKTVNGEQLAYTGTVFLVDPAGKLHAIFSMPYTVDSIIMEYKNILLHYK